jgi:hypothetical protein
MNLRFYIQLAGNFQDRKIKEVMVTEHGGWMKETRNANQILVEENFWKNETETLR